MRSVRTSQACNFQDMWKWKSARPIISRNASYAPENHLILELIFLYMSHMIFIVLKKKNSTTHLLLTNPTAVCLNGSWLEVYYTTSVSSVSLSQSVVFNSWTDINSVTSSAIALTKQTFRRTSVTMIGTPISFSVDFLVSPKVTCYAETLATLFTFIWPLSSMNSLVHPQISCLLETFATLFTFIWLLSSMNSFMHPQISCLLKTLATLFTFIRPLSSMNSFMHPQICCLSKTLATLFTLVWPQNALWRHTGDVNWDLSRLCCYAPADTKPIQRFTSKLPNRTLLTILVCVTKL